MPSTCHLTSPHLPVVVFVINMPTPHSLNWFNRRLPWLHSTGHHHPVRQDGVLDQGPDAGAVDVVPVLRLRHPALGPSGDDSPHAKTSQTLIVSIDHIRIKYHKPNNNHSLDTLASQPTSHSPSFRSPAPRSVNEGVIGNGRVACGRLLGRSCCFGIAWPVD